MSTIKIKVMAFARKKPCQVENLEGTFVWILYRLVIENFPKTDSKINYQSVSMKKTTYFSVVNWNYKAVYCYAMRKILKCLVKSVCAYEIWKFKYTYCIIIVHVYFLHCICWCKYLLNTFLT